jgi:hypothetical protein
MTNADHPADGRVSNWTLATGSKPGAREVCSPSTVGTPGREKPEAKAA